MSVLRKALNAAAIDVMRALVGYFTSTNTVLHRVNLNYSEDVATAPSCEDVKDAFITCVRRQFDTELAIAHKGIIPYFIKDLPLFNYGTVGMETAFSVVAYERHGLFHYYLDINWDKAVQVLLPTYVLRNTFVDIEVIKRHEGGKLPDHKLPTEIQIPEYIPLDRILFSNSLFQESFTRLLASYGRSYDSLSTRHVSSTKITKWKYTY